MAIAKPEVMKYLQQNHKKLWTRSQHGTDSKVDYVTKNLAESFNNWIKAEKAKHIDDLMDTIRQMLLIKWNNRKKVAKKFGGKILPHVM
jgi:ribosomal protein L16 Arg81 hydroxylase